MFELCGECVSIKVPQCSYGADEKVNIMIVRVVRRLEHVVKH